MIDVPRYPSLFQINPHVSPRRESVGGNKKSLTLADIGEAIIDELSQRGVDWIRLLKVGQTGPVRLAVTQSDPEWRAEFNANAKTLLPSTGGEDRCW